MKNTFLILFFSTTLSLCFGQGGGTTPVSDIPRLKGNANRVLSTNGKKLEWKSTTTIVDSALATKVDKVTGKVLSTNDYTTTEKSKLAGIATGATANSTDAQLRDRATHTGTQLSSTISNFTTSVVSSLPQPIDVTATPIFKGFKLSRQITLPAVSSGVAIYNVSGNIVVKDSVGTKTLAYTSDYIPLLGTSSLAGSIIPNASGTFSLGSASFPLGTVFNVNNKVASIQAFNSGGINFYNNTATTLFAKLFDASGNFVLQDGGTFLDYGDKLRVEGKSLLRTLNIGTRQTNNSGTQALLFANGNWDGTGDPQMYVAGGGGNDAQRLQIGYNTTGDYAVLQSTRFGVGHRNIVLNPGGGNVSIGTAINSGYTFDVNGPGRISGEFTLGSTHRGTFLSNSLGLEIRAVDGQDITMKLGTTERLRFTTAGNVGIGTAAPTAKLHVTGLLNDGNNLTQFDQTGTGRAMFVSKDVASSTRPVATFSQANLTGGQPTISIRQADPSKSALAINEDGNLSTYNFEVYPSGYVKTIQDIEITDNTKGIILKSPDGTRYRIKVANGGTLTATAL